MKKRTCLPSGTLITMPNGGTYIIKELLGEGGFSLVYSAESPGVAVPLAIKEFFPADGAERSEDLTVQPVHGFEERFERRFEQFEAEGAYGARALENNFQVLPVLSQGGGYAVMLRRSGDMTSLADLAAHWDNRPPLPLSGLTRDADPVFTDLVRVRYALAVADSLLTALDSLHKSGRLHLDLSSGNVLWAGQSQDTGRNCSAFLTDFGNAAQTDGSSWKPSALLSYSPGFAAPELCEKGAALTAATDLYSVGMLLLELCLGPERFEKTAYLLAHRHFPEQVPAKALNALRLPERIHSALAALVSRAAAPQAERFQTAAEMQSALRAVMDAIPLRPVNPDVTREFTLNSLRSMLLGAPDAASSWAGELRDRRAPGKAVPEYACKKLTCRAFEDDNGFLAFLLPEGVYNRLCERTRAPYMPGGVMACNYDSTVKAELCELVFGPWARRLLQSCRTLLDDERLFFSDCLLLFDLLGEDGKQLRRCMQRCNYSERAYVGLALLAAYALVGRENFERALPESRAAKVFGSNA